MTNKDKYLISQEIDDWAKITYPEQFSYLDSLIEEHNTPSDRNVKRLEREINSLRKNFTDNYELQVLKQWNQNKFFIDVENIENATNYRNLNSNFVCFGFSPSVYYLLGYKKVPFFMSARHVYTCMKKDGFIHEPNTHYHNLGIDTIKSIPFNLDNVILIAQDKTHSETIVSVLDYEVPLLDKNNEPTGDNTKLQIFIKPKGKDISLYYSNFINEGNLIASSYALSQSIDLHKILYINKDKISHVPQLISTDMQSDNMLGKSITAVGHPWLDIYNIKKYVADVNHKMNIELPFDYALLKSINTKLSYSQEKSNDIIEDCIKDSVLHEPAIPNLTQTVPTISEEVSNFTQTSDGVLDVIGKRIDIGFDGKPTLEGFNAISQIMNIYSDKRYETARYLFVNKGQIIRQISVSSQTPGSTIIRPNDDFLYKIRSYAEDTDSKIVFLHNHPSGFTEPSDADITLTDYLANFFQRQGEESLFAGHIILDHGSYGLYTEKTKQWAGLINGELHPLDDIEKVYLKNLSNQGRHAIFDSNFSITSQSLKELSEYAKKCDSLNLWNTKDWIPGFLMTTNGIIKSFEVFGNDEFKNIDILSEKLKSIGRNYGSENVIFFPRYRSQFLATERYAQLSGKIKDIYFEKEDGTFELSQFPNGNIFNDLTRGDIKVSDSENYAEEVKIKIESENKKQKNRNNLKTRREFLADKTEITDEEIITLLDLPVEKRSKNPEFFTNKSYKELKDNPAELEKLADDLKEKPEYLKYHSTYIAKSKLLYQESAVLYNEIPCLIVLDKMNIPVYLLPYDYAKDKKGTDVAFADSLKSDVFTDFKRVFNARFKHSIEKGVEQGKDIFFLINNEKLNYDEIKRQLIRFTNGRKSENKEGTFLFFSEKDYVCYAFESDKNGFITELSEYDLKQIRLTNISKPFTPSRETENNSESLASNLNIAQENSEVNKFSEHDLKQIKLANKASPLHPTRSQTEMSATSSDKLNLSQNTLAVNELLPSLLLRGEINILETKKDIENRKQRYLNAVTSLENLNFLIQSETIKKSNDIFVKNQKESHFYKDVQNLFVENTNQLYKENKIMENEKTVTSEMTQNVKERTNIKAIDIWNEIKDFISDDPQYESKKFEALDYLYIKGSDDSAGYENSFERNLRRLEAIGDKQLQQIFEKYKDYQIDFDDQALYLKIAGTRNSNFNEAKQNFINLVENKKYLRESDFEKQQTANVEKQLETEKTENAHEMNKTDYFFRKLHPELSSHKPLEVISDDNGKKGVDFDFGTEGSILPDFTLKLQDDKLHDFKNYWIEKKEYGYYVLKNSEGNHVSIEQDTLDEITSAENVEKFHDAIKLEYEKKFSNEIAQDLNDKFHKLHPELSSHSIPEIRVNEKGEKSVVISFGGTGPMLPAFEIKGAYDKEPREFKNFFLKEKHDGYFTVSDGKTSFDITAEKFDEITSVENVEKFLNDIEKNYNAEQEKKQETDEEIKQEKRTRPTVNRFVNLVSKLSQEERDSLKSDTDKIISAIKDENKDLITLINNFSDKDDIKENLVKNALDIINENKIIQQNRPLKFDKEKSSVTTDEPKRNIDNDLKNLIEELRKENADLKNSFKMVQEKLKQTMEQNNQLLQQIQILKDPSKQNQEVTANESIGQKSSVQPQGQTHDGNSIIEGFSKNNAYIVNTKVPKFGYTENGKVFYIDNARFVKLKEDGVDASNNKVILEYTMEKGEQKQIEMEQREYNNMINGVEEFREKIATSKVSSWEWIKAHQDLRQSLNIDQFTYRMHTTENFTHNFEVHCRIDCNNRKDAMNVLALMVKEFSPAERKEFNRYRNRNGGVKFDKMLIDTFDRIHAEKSEEAEMKKNNDRFFKDVIETADGIEKSILQSNNKDFNELKQGDLIPGSIKTRVGDTIEVSMTTKNPTGEVIKMPSEELKIIKVSQNVKPNRAMLYNEKTKASYLIPLYKLQECIQKKELAMGLKPQKKQKQKTKKKEKNHSDDNCISM